MPPRSIRHLLHENSVCISFQNGLGNEEVIADEVGADKVLGGLTAMAGQLLGPGRIRDFSRVSIIYWGDAWRSIGTGSQHCRKAHLFRT